MLLPFDAEVLAPALVSAPVAVSAPAPAEVWAPVLVSALVAVSTAGGRPARRVRTLTGPAAVLDSLSGTGRSLLSYGLATLDDASGGLLPGRLALIAAAPGVGGSLLAASAARDAAVVKGRTVLYAASGPSAADVSCRVAAAYVGVNYQLLRAGTGGAAMHLRAALDRPCRPAVHRRW